MTRKRHALEWSDGAAGPVLGTLEGDWRNLSACRTEDPALFFSPDDERETTFERQARETLALAVCDLCPVVAECESFVLTHGIRHGVFAGKGEREREPLHDTHDRRVLAAGRKLCPACHTEKPLKACTAHEGSRDGHYGECKSCLADSARWLQSFRPAA
jgi:hypothetical protein